MSTSGRNKVLGFDPFGRVWDYARRAEWRKPHDPVAMLSAQSHGPILA